MIVIQSTLRELIVSSVQSNPQTLEASVNYYKRIQDFHDEAASYTVMTTGNFKTL